VRSISFARNLACLLGCFGGGGGDSRGGILGCSTDLASPGNIFIIFILSSFGLFGRRLVRRPISARSNFGHKKTAGDKTNGSSSLLCVVAPVCATRYFLVL
jgi:hypothetical protein